MTRPLLETEAPVLHAQPDDGERDRLDVQAIRERDEQAFARLFRRYGPTALGLAVRILRDPSLAQDVVQAVFLQLWRAPSYRAERGSVRSWLLAAVHHRAVDTVRREEVVRRRAAAATAASDIDIRPDVAEDVVEMASLRDRRAAARAALQTIPREQRRVLEMMYFGGRTQQGVAAELGLPLGTVKSRCLLGMRALRSVLATDVRVHAGSPGAS